MKFFGKYREKYDVYLIKPFCSVKVRKKDLFKKKNFFKGKCKNRNAFWVGIRQCTQIGMEP